ncbi:MAG: hypothetical protein IJ659_05190, partial [Alloprevotella sp.]|nr:hypothetical protein [Alloprevotella sp.]
VFWLDVLFDFRAKVSIPAYSPKLYAGKLLRHRLFPVLCPGVCPSLCPGAAVPPICRHPPLPVPIILHIFALQTALQAFSLPYFEFVYDEHWDLGHGWNGDMPR